MNYVVVGPDPLVTEDLADIVLQCDSEASVEVIPTLKSLESMPEAEVDSVFVFVGVSAQRIASSSAICRQLNRAIRVMYVGDAFEAPPEQCSEWMFVPAPFTTESISTALRVVNSAWLALRPAFRAGKPA